jgi:hypothetical protein
MKLKDNELVRFFQNSIGKDVFIYDDVFIEENKQYFNKERLISQLDNNVYIIFPIVAGASNNIVGFVYIGKKMF